MATQSLKRLILIRHAHRDTSDRDRDNGLSEKGHGQAKNLVKRARTELSAKARTRFLTSPKLRCVETIGPIVEELDGELEVSALLDEGPRLSERVDEFVEWWRSSRSPQVTVACSHGDWIPECLQRLTGQAAELGKGDWAEISLEVWENP